MKPKVVIAEDDYLILQGALLPALSTDFDVVASVSNGQSALTAVDEYRPEIVLLDVSLPVLRGFEAARRILASHPECKVLFVSNYWDNVYIDEARKMGASGYVFKSRVSRELPCALQLALKGEFYYSAH